MPPERLFTPLINLFKINALGGVEMCGGVANLQNIFCQAFNYSCIFFLPPSIRPFQKLATVWAANQDVRQIRGWVGGEGARMCRHHRADTDDKSSTYGQLSHRPTWLACAWCGRKHEHRRRGGVKKMKEKKQSNLSRCDCHGAASSLKIFFLFFACCYNFYSWHGRMW